MSPPSSRSSSPSAILSIWAPVTGGGTEDALLIHLPGLGVLFMGDALMFYGEPWVEAEELGAVF